MQSPIHVLLVEDNPVDVRLVEAKLAQSGVEFSFQRAATLGAAIESLSRRQTDVVLLDLTLPDSSDLETFARLHSKCLDIPIVILTGREDAELAINAVRDGAQDYLYKGKIDSESLARSIRYAIERSNRQKAEKELGAAGEIHRHLLPKAAPLLPTLDISGRCEPATFAGGDYFDFFAMQGNRLGIVVADVAGHGIGPSLMMSETRAVLRTLAPIIHDVGDLLSRANQVIEPDLMDNAFVATFIACIDPDTRTFEYAGAGHLGYVLDKTGNQKQLLKTYDPPLGVLANHVYSSSTAVTLEPGESLFVFTDGIVEPRDSKGQPFGEERLFDAVQAKYTESAACIIERVFEAVKDFTRRNTQPDDMTAIFAKARADSASNGPNEDGF